MHQNLKQVRDLRIPLTEEYNIRFDLKKSTLFSVDFLYYLTLRQTRSDLCV